MAVIKLLIGKVLYGLLFCVALPAFLIWWAATLNVDLPIPASWKGIGYFVMASGLVLMLKAMHQLWRDGKGLPMNAYPPQHYVSTGAYYFFRHPIYTGFCLMSAGFAITAGSPAGLYVVTPVVILLCITLVAGFERPDLVKRFSIKSHQSLFSLPQRSNDNLKLFQKSLIVVSAFTPWVILYEILIAIEWNVGYINSMTPFEKEWPVFEFAEIPYAFTYLFVCSTPALLRTKSDARDFLTLIWLATAVGIFLQIVLPFYCEPRHFTPASILGEWILFERKFDGWSAALPSFHVLWALIAALFWSRRFPKLNALWWSITSMIVLSCIGTGVHSLADVGSAILIFTTLFFRNEILTYLQRRLEQIANSWQAWQIGPIRIINHSVYAGLAAAFGTLLLITFSIDYEAILLVTSCSLIGGALWGQYLEGSASMLRPFGYFGALFGGVAGVAVSSVFLRTDFFTLLSAFAMAAPCTQAIGRIRCLVQGCCHGSHYDGILSIKYYNEHSRVTKISNLKNVSLHNTQLYSIALNVIIGSLLFRFWYGGASATSIIGTYFTLTGCARFIEEAYRGETQTRYISGLTVYQWLCITFIIGGILASSMAIESKIIFSPAISTSSIITIITVGVAWAFAMGMDFPKSKVRFSRLTG